MAIIIPLSIVAAAQININDGEHAKLLYDWELLKLLNEISEKKRDLQKSLILNLPMEKIMQAIDKAKQHTVDNIASLNVPFKMPEVEMLAVFWPGNIEP